MAEGGTVTFRDPDGYAAAFGDARVNLTTTGAGDFKAQLTRLKLQHLQTYRCRERLPRIAYISLSSARVFVSFPWASKRPCSAALPCGTGTWFFTAAGSTCINGPRAHANGA
jgi:hypothetical protein